MVPLQDLEDYYFKAKLVLDYEWSAADKVAKKFGLNVISTQGTTRAVFKEPYKRDVIKLGFPTHNRGEYVFSKYVKGTKHSHLFAETREITPQGYFTRQEFVRKSLPQVICFLSDKNWYKFREILESCFSFVRLAVGNAGVTFDFHDENFKVSSDGNLKLVDYSDLACSMFCKDYNLKPETAVNRLKRVDIPPRDLNLTYSKDYGIRLAINDTTYHLPSLEDQSNETFL